MPELPEVETVCKGLADHMIGKRVDRLVLKRPDLRFPLPQDLPQRVSGAVVTDITRRGKYYLVHLKGRGTLIGHLGMSGRFSICQNGGSDAPHDHVVIYLQDGSVIRYCDPRRFGMMDFVSDDGHLHPWLAGMGPEPLSDEFTTDYLVNQLAKRSGPIKPVLLDQKLVAGIGNIYACEALYQARISPLRRANTIKAGRGARLVAAIKDVLNAAIASGGSSLKDYVQASGEMGYFQHKWAVYGKGGQKCPNCTCQKGIKQVTQSGRSTFYCSIRQR